MVYGLLYNDRTWGRSQGPNVRVQKLVLVRDLGGEDRHKRDEDRRRVVGEKGCYERCGAVFVYPIMWQVRVGVPRQPMAVNLPESPYKPLYCFDSRQQPQLPTNQTEKRVDSPVQLGILGGGHLCPVFILALLAE